MLTKEQKQTVLRAMESWENDAPESVVSHYDEITIYFLKQFWLGMKSLEAWAESEAQNDY